MQGEKRDATDPRSPVQPARDPAPYLLLAAVAAVAIWSFQQSIVQDLDSSQPTRTETAHQDRARLQSKPSGKITGLFGADDYPVEAIDRNQQGTVGVQLDINKRGRVSRCTVIRSSNSESLDKATCRILRQRARFSPALDADGRPVRGTYVQQITWRIAD